MILGRGPVDKTAMVVSVVLPIAAIVLVILALILGDPEGLSQMVR